MQLKLKYLLYLYNSNKIALKRRFLLKRLLNSVKLLVSFIKIKT